MTKLLVFQLSKYVGLQKHQLINELVEQVAHHLVIVIGTYLCILITIKFETRFENPLYVYIRIKSNYRNYLNTIRENRC